MSRLITEVSPLIPVRNLIELSLAMLNPASIAEVSGSFQNRRAVCIKKEKLFQIIAALWLQSIVGEYSKDKNWSNKPKFSPTLYPILFSQFLRDTGRSFSLGKLRLCVLGRTASTSGLLYCGENSLPISISALFWHIYAELTRMAEFKK